MHKKKSCVNLCYLLLLLFATNVNATVYQWTDSHGNVHYSDTPNANNAQPVEINAAPLSTDSDIEQRNQTLIEKQRQDKIKQQKDAAKQAETDKEQAYNKQVAQLCQKSKDNLKLLNETGRRVYTVDAKGEYHYFSDDERLQEIQRLQAQVKQYCQ